ncbi:MAG: hypothetical protein PVI59_02195 [Anaerolineae bacterium]
MKRMHIVFVVGHFITSLLFITCAVALMVFAVLELWEGINPAQDLALQERLNAVLESIAVLTVSVASLELGQTIMEEEVQRDVPMSIPSRVRRFLSRFMIVLVVSLSIESLVAVFRFVHQEPEQLPNAAVIGLVAAALMAAWGVFIKLNRSAEELEAEAIDRVRQEDHKVTTESAGSLHKKG